MMRGFEPLSAQSWTGYIVYMLYCVYVRVFVCCSYSVAVITSDFESENSSSNLDRSYRNWFA